MTITHSTTIPSRATTTKPVVLFVDDDKNVLAALRATLRQLRRTYDFLFTDGADAALGILADEPVDVVVTDMRMPGLTGADLLWALSTELPQVVRFVLSGEADRDLMMRALPVTHRWLTKPCDREQLADALADAVRYRGLLSDPAIKAAVAGADSLPSPPGLYLEMMALLADPDVSAAQVADLAGTDAAISAKLLQWANSAFSGGKPVQDVHAAVVRIGITAVCQLVLSEGTIRALDPPDTIPGLDADVLATHATAVGDCSGRMAHRDVAVTARVGGVLSNVGILLAAGRLGVSLVEAERDLCGVSHPELAGHLLSIWGLPTDLVLAVAGSHDHPEPRLRPPLDPRDAVRVGRLVAQRLPHAAQMGAPHVDRLDPLLEAAVARWSETIAEHQQGSA